MRQLLFTPALTLLTLLIAAIGLGCADEGPSDPPGGGAGGSIQVFTNTTGINTDADGYRVRVSGQGVNRTENLGPIDDVTFGGLPAGDYTVSLEAVAANCVVDEPRVSFSLTETSPRLIPFSIVCS